MLAVLLAAAVAAPVDVDLGFLGSAPVCRLMSQVNINGNRRMCCESCLAPYLLDSEWVTWNNVDLQAEHSAQRHSEVAANADGSGAGTLLATDERSALETVLVKQSSASVPCGICVTASSCLATNGYVNTWHRLCQRSRGMPAPP